MVCGICKNKFIHSSNLEDCYKQKRKLDKKIMKMLNGLTDDEVEAKQEELWNILLNYEALVLMPNCPPPKCNSEKCGSLICTFCYNKKGELCLECKKNIQY